MHTADETVEEQARRYYAIVQRLRELPNDSPEHDALKDEATAIMQNLENGLSAAKLKRLLEYCNS